MARRAQIVQHAIAVIAELGYAQTSIGQIAKHAKISKGVISYHFSSKDELIGAVIMDVMTRFDAFVRSRLEDDSSSASLLKAFMIANIDFMRDHRDALLALFEIIQNARTEEGKAAFEGGVIETDVRNLEQVLTEGQQQGEFREFDVHMMAIAILSVRNGMLMQLAADPNPDYTKYADEFSALIDYATRKIS